MGDCMTKTKNISTDYLKELLESKDVKPSFQRLSILKYIIQKKNHPSVDTIFKALSKDIPTLSKTTIYNTLNLLTQKGIVTALTIADNETRYDFGEEHHAHFQCTVCGMVFDVKVDSDFCDRDFIDGHKVDEVQVHFKGVCSNCLNKK